jgi:hypothetical protein
VPYDAPVVGNEKYAIKNSKTYFLYIYLFGWLECVVGPSFAYVARFVFLRLSGFKPKELP